MRTKRSGCAAVSAYNKIYVLGGRNCSSLSSVEVYDITKKKWILRSTMKIKRSGGAATFVGGRIYVVGGFHDITDHSSCEVFHISSNTWSYFPDMQERRSGCQAVRISTKMYVMGGGTQSTEFSSVEAFETSGSRRSRGRKRSISQITRRVKEETIDLSDVDTIQHPGESEIDSQRLHTSQNDPPSKTGQERVTFLENKAGLKHGSSELLIKRIEYLEINIFGKHSNGESIINRLDALEASYFGKKERRRYSYDS